MAVRTSAIWGGTVANAASDEYLSFIDISEAQGTFKGPIAAAAHVTGVIIRSSDGKKVDRQFLRFLGEAARSQLLVGVYHFIRPLSTGATAQARLWLQTVRQGVQTIGRPLDLPLMADVEKYWRTKKGQAPLAGDQLAAWLKEFLSVAESEGADLVVPGAAIPNIYSGAGFWQQFVANDATFGRHGLVLARYPGQRTVTAANGKQHFEDTPPPADARSWAHFAWNIKADPSPKIIPGFARWDAWQFSADGNHAGASVGVGSDAVDCNIFEADSVRRWTGGVAPTPVAPPQPPPAPDTTEAIVKQLPDTRPGARGDHVKRIQALLLAAGFDPGTIDGIYTANDPNGPTFKAIVAFQTAHNLKPDGNVGIKQTWPALLGLQ
jgi:GH25 family lysozyme M1 (1,4-beta-N-acetylmuramidase)